MLTAFQCLFIAVYFEAAGESLLGKFGVAEVIINRVEDTSGEFRKQNTVCDVVKHYKVKRGVKVCAFSFYCDGLSDTPKLRNRMDKYALEESKAVAQAVLDGHNPGVVGYSLWYHRIDIAPWWNSGLCFERRIGDHIFWKRCQG